MAHRSFLHFAGVLFCFGLSEAAAPPWNLRFLNGTTSYPNARCLDGTPYGYFVQYSQINSSRWLFYLEGGNWCNSEGVCRNRVAEPGAGGGSSNRLRAGDFDGLNMVDYDPTNNPDFYNDHHVFMPYCSGDLWTGRRTMASNETFGLYFAGQLIIDAMLDVMQNHGASIGRPVTEVVFAGGSAGANGVMLNINFIRDRLPPSVRVVGFPNAGWTSNDTRSYPQYLLNQASNATAEIRIGAGIWDAYIEPACVAHYGPLWNRCFGYSAYPFLRAEMFIAQSTFELGAPVATAPYEANTIGFLEEHGAIINAQMELLRNQTHAANGLFQPSCVAHTIHWYQILVNGTSLRQAFGDWYFNRTGRKIWSEPFTPLPCNPSPLCGWNYCGSSSTTGVPIDWTAGPPCAYDASGSTGRFVNSSLGPLSAKLTDLTLSTWVWLNATHTGSADQYIVMIGAAPANGYGLVVNANGASPVAMRYWGVTLQTLPNYNLPLKTWTFLSAVSATLNKWEFYANGNYLGSVTFQTSLIPPTAGVVVGGAIAANNRNFDGRIGSLQFWTTARSPYQLLFDSMDQFTGTVPGLALFVPFCDGNVTTVALASGAGVMLGRNGTVRWYKREAASATTIGAAPTTALVTTSTGTTSTGTTSTGTTTGTSSTGTTSSGSTGTTSTGTTSTGTTGTSSTGSSSTGTTSTGTTSTGTTSTGTTSTGTTSTGSTGTTSTGTTSTGTTSTGTTSSGTTSTGSSGTLSSGTTSTGTSGTTSTGTTGTSGTTSSGTTSTGTSSTGTTSTGTTSTGTTSTSTGTTSTGSTSSGTTSTGTTSTGTTTTGTTSTGTTSTGTTSTGTTSTGTTSTGTTSTGTTSTGPPSAGTTTQPATVVVERWRYTSYLVQSSSVSGWRSNYTGTVGPGNAVPVGTMVRDVSLKGRDQTTVHVTLAPSETSATLYVLGWSNPLPAGSLVVGLRITIARRATAVGLQDTQMALVLGGTLRPASSQCPGVSACGWLTNNNPLVQAVYGGPTSTWGLAPAELTAAGFNAVSSGTQLGFGYAITVANSGSMPIEAFMEQSEMTIWYTSGSGTTSTGTTSTGTTSTGTTSTGTTSTGTTSTGTTSTGTTSTGTSADASPPGTSSAPGTTGAVAAVGTTAQPVAPPPPPPPAVQQYRYTSYLVQSSSVGGWRSNYTGTVGPGNAVPVGTMVRDVSLKGRDQTTVHVTLAPSETSSTLYVLGWSNPLPAAATIVGIRLFVTRRATAVGLEDTHLSLVVGGTVRPASNQCPGAAACSWVTNNNPLVAVSFGGPTSTWGLGPDELTTAGVNAASSGTQLGFGYALSTRNTGSVPIEAFFEQTEMTIWYTTASATTSTGTTSTGTTSTGTTSTGTTSTGTTSTGTTSTGTPSPGTTSTGSTSPGTSHDTTAPPAVLSTGQAFASGSVVRACTWLGKSSTSYSWNRQYVSSSEPRLPVTDPPSADSSLTATDGVFAHNNLARGVTGAVLYALGFTSPALPPGARVTGLEVSIVRSGGNAQNPPQTAQLSLIIDGALRSSTNRCPNNCSDFTVGLHEVRYGGPDELWGLSPEVLTAALDAPPAAFGVGFQVTNPRSVSMSILVDAMSMTAYYTAPVGSGGAALEDEIRPSVIPSAGPQEEVAAASGVTLIAVLVAVGVVVAAVAVVVVYRRRQLHRAAQVAPVNVVIADPSADLSQS